MNNNQLNKLSMYHNERHLLNQYRSRWEHMAGFVSAVNRFNGRIATIEATQAKQSLNISGATTTKAVAKAELITEMLEVSGAIVAYALATGNPGLADRMSFSRTDLESLRASELISSCNNAVTEALSIMPPEPPEDGDPVPPAPNPLAAYGITPARISDFQEQITAYRDTGDLPRMFITQRAAATAALEEQFRETDTILEGELDNLMLQFRNDGTGFYADYIAARVVVDTGSGGNGLRGTVTDSVTGQVLEGAVVSFKELRIERITDSNGHYSFRRVAPGTYIITVHLPGYVSETLTNVSIGNTLRSLDIRLTKAELLSA